ncbi:MAG: Zn-dependent hydrolase [Ruminococcus sp.]|jgi:N-carbamoyl-L-amino-acid hydrolase
MYYCDRKRMQEKIEAFYKFGKERTGGVTRLSLSPEALAARKEFVRRCQEMSMKIKTDDMGNIYATLDGSGKNLPAIMSGSHLDSVKDGGNYDGTLGVLAALEMAETIVKDKIPHRHPITLAVWTNEEGSRFDPCMMSSGVLSGKFSREEMMQSKDEAGLTFEEALKNSGYEGKKENRASGENTKAYVELHVEQGPVLDGENIQIGIVEGVLGMEIYEFTVLGQSDHAGTTPMKCRKDAFYGAAKLLCLLHEKLDKLDEKLVYTTGRITSHPNVHTVIPDRVTFTLDARHQDMKVLGQVRETVESMPKVMEKCQISSKLLWERHTTLFDRKIVKSVEESTKELGCRAMSMYSGAGHDAQYLAEIIPTAMIFVPSVDGRSHCRQEYTKLEDCAAGTDVLLNTILRIDQE